MSDTQTDAQADELVLVKYVRNADPNNSTGEIELRGDRERDNIAIGGVGYLTTAEIGRLAQYGMELVVIEEDEAKSEGLLVDAPAAAKPLEEQNRKELDATAASEEPPVDISGLRTNSEIANKIQKARDAANAPPEGAASLPAGAGGGPGTTPPVATAPSTTTGNASAS